MEYFRDEMIKLHKKGDLSDGEIVDLMGFVNTIITHITNGNHNEERLVNIMGGTVIETESERLIRLGENRGLSRGREEGFSLGRDEGFSLGREEGFSLGREEGFNLGLMHGVKMLIQMGREFNLDDADILQQLQDKVDLSLEKAIEYLDKYGK